MKIKTKKLFVLLFTMLMVLSVSACGKDEGANQNGSEISNNDAMNESQDEVVESDGYEKFSQLEIGMTESEVNAILGEPAKVDKAYYYYNLMVNGQEAEVQVWINTTSGLVTYISGDFNDGHMCITFDADGNVKSYVGYC